MAAERFATLLEMLAYRARFSGEQPAFTFEDRPTTYGEVWESTQRFGACLLELGLTPGERVILALPNSAEFFPAFYGTQQAGGMAVPVFPGSGAGRVFSLANLCGARFIVAPSNLSKSSLAKHREAAAEQGLTVLTVTDSAKARVPGQFPEVLPGDVAFLQYTSGSTGNPKGVMLTHQGLLTNVRQMIAGMEITPDDIFISWLPVYHDMGLILKTMVPFYLEAALHLLPTDLRDVRAWLGAIEQHRGTFTAAPDFAYRLILRHIQPGEFDLSSLRVALNAAEHVRATTVRGFEALFDLKNVMTAGYGLAEATVGVSMSRPGTPLRVDSHQRVSVGRPFPQVEVIVHNNNEILPAGQTGEIAIHSPANSPGYFNNPEATTGLFRKDGYLDSGDLGYLDEDGYLYIVSRKKDIIKRSGETIAPQEIEEIADGAPGVRFSAAVGVDRGGIEGEQAYLFAEVREGQAMAEDEQYEIALQIVARVHAHMGFRPGRVYLLKQHGIPLTHNGKIQHGRLKERYLDGSLRARGMILFPEY